MRLLIVSHVVHYRQDDGYYAYSPYAKEIEIWADLFTEIVIASPCRDEAPPEETSRIRRSNIRLAPQREVGGTRWRDKVGIVIALPALLISLMREMSKADAIHARCPGNLGLLGVILGPLFSRRLIAKYAGQWDGFPGEEWTVRLQRFLLRSRWWRGPVTVYGKKPSEADHVVNFFTSIFTADQLARGRASALTKRIPPVMTVAFVGRLSRAKNVHILLEAIAVLKAEGLPLKGLVIGDGPEREFLRTLANKLSIEDQVKFTGGVSPECIPDLLEQADIFVLAPLSEGWGKSILEAMAFGLVCIGGNLGLMPTFLAEQRGLTVTPGDVGALADILRRVVSAPEQYSEMRLSASQWAQRYSLEGLRDALQKLMIESWKLPETALLAHNVPEIQ